MAAPDSRGGSKARLVGRRARTQLSAVSTPNQWLDLGAFAGIDAIAWAACFDPTPAPPEVVLALDITPERDPTATLGGGRVSCPPEPHHHLEVIEHTLGPTAHLGRPGAGGRGTPRHPPGHRPRVTGRGVHPTWPIRGSTTPATARGSRIKEIPGTELARASGEFHRRASWPGLIAHRGDPRLSDAVLGASKRKYGDGWLWNRRTGVDITPLVAGTLARWGVLTTTVADPAIY